MAVYWVNYDLNEPGLAYERLIPYLKSHTSWAKPLKSSFFVATSLSAERLLEGAVELVDSSDSIVVVRVDSQWWATYGLPDSVIEWMRLYVKA